jgi:hypothetical protein
MLMKLTKSARLPALLALSLALTAGFAHNANAQPSKVASSVGRHGVYTVPWQNGFILRTADAFAANRMARAALFGIE